MDEEVKDEERRRTAVLHGVRWSWAVLVQAARLREALDVAEDSRHDRPSHYGHEERIPFLRLHTDRHFLLNAARNLLRAVELLGRPDSAPEMVSPTMAKHLTILRDCFEHWDDEEHTDTGKGLAGRAFRLFNALQLTESGGHLPEHPTSLAWSTDMVLIGGLRLEDLEALANQLLEYFRDLEENTSFVWRGWSAVPSAKV